MDGDERARRLAGLQAIVTARDPGDWIDEQIADIGAKAQTSVAVALKVAED